MPYTVNWKLHDVYQNPAKFNPGDVLLFIFLEYRAWVRVPLETDIIILNFSLPARSEQLSGVHANETKHDHSPTVIVVLDQNTISHTKSSLLIAAGYITLKQHWHWSKGVCKQILFPRLVFMKYWRCVRFFQIPIMWTNRNFPFLESQAVLPWQPNFTWYSRGILWAQVSLLAVSIIHVYYVKEILNSKQKIIHKINIIFLNVNLLSMKLYFKLFSWRRYSLRGRGKVVVSKQEPVELTIIHMSAGTCGLKPRLSTVDERPETKLPAEKRIAKFRKNTIRITQNVTASNDSDFFEWWIVFLSL